MVNISIIRLESSDWLYNAGLVGIMKIFDENEVEYTSKSNYIEFEDTALENFEEKYFNYFINKYEKFTSWYRIVSFQDKIINFSQENATEEFLKTLNAQIEYTKTKLKSASYKSAYNIIKNDSIDLLDREKNLKKVSKNKKDSIGDIIPQIKKQLHELDSITNYLKLRDVKRIIIGKNIIYDIIAKFWSDVSFLNKNNNKKDMYIEYKNYFVDDTFDYIRSDKEKYKYNCFSCYNNIAKLSKPYSYDLTWINKIGVDMSRKTSHFWGLYGDSFICPLCNLIYSCVPVGFTVIRDRGIFINQNSDLRTLKKVNNTVIDNNTSFEDLEYKSYFSIADNIKQSEIERIDKEIENIQIIKLDSNNERRPYTFNIISKDKLKILSNNKKALRKLTESRVKTDTGDYINLYSEVIGRIYNNKNLFDLINKLFYLNLSNKFKNLYYLKYVIKINNSFLGGAMGKKLYYKKIDEIQELGFELRMHYKNRKAENKINGTAYRLLNALKTKNSSRFMDTLLNAYMYIGKSVPVDFVEGLKDNSKLQTIGYAFLLGLQGEDNRKQLDVQEKGENINE